MVSYYRSIIIQFLWISKVIHLQLKIKSDLGTLYNNKPNVSDLIKGWIILKLVYMNIMAICIQIHIRKAFFLIVTEKKFYTCEYDY